MTMGNKFASKPAFLCTNKRYFAKGTKNERLEKEEAQKEALRIKYQNVDLETELREWTESFESCCDDLQTELSRLFLQP